MNSRKARIEREVFEIDRLTSTSMVAISVFVVIQLLQLNSLDLALYISLFCFALCLPTMAISVMILNIEQFHKIKTRPKSIDRFGMIGLLAGFVGIAAVFYHFSWQACLLFVVVGIYVHSISYKYWKALNKLKDEDAA